MIETDIAVAIAPTMAVVVAALFARRNGVHQNGKLDRIEVLVDGRLDKALETIVKLERLLETERKKSK